MRSRFQGFTPYALAVCAGALAIGAAGCTSAVPHCTPIEVPVVEGPHIDYALIEYRSGGEQGKPPQVEISDTAAYRNEHTNFHAAAIRLPDSCLATTAAGATGISSAGNTQNILSTACGVWLSELERSLTQNGFRVFSWDALRGLERQKNLSPYEAGRQLGAEVVFVFNSLDASPVRAGGQTGASFKYFNSDAKGDRLSPLALDDTTRQQFRDFAKTYGGGETPGGAIVALSSTLDSTAIITGTDEQRQRGVTAGESIWFYRRTVTIPIRSKTGKRFLFAKLAGSGWMPARPELPPVAAVAQLPQVKTEDVVETQTAAAVEDAYAAERLELIRTAAADFVTKFRTGGK